MSSLICYKQMPEWNSENLPQMFQEKHNTKEGTWAKLTILKGCLNFYLLDENGNVLNVEKYDEQHQPPFIQPQVWHKVEVGSADLVCQLGFYCEPKDYYAKKYNLTSTHSEVLNAVNYIQSGKVLDLGCGRGRNSLFLNLLGFEVDSLDHSEDSIAFLNTIIEKEQLTAINAKVYDIHTANIQQKYDFILSTVVMMFLNRDKIPQIIQNMQQQTNVGGYNLIVCAMDTEKYPCTMPFPFAFKENELKAYYQGWELVKYNEDLGHLHKTDAQGNRIQLQFVTMLAKKIAE